MTREKLINNTIEFIEREYLHHVMTFYPYKKELEQGRALLRSELCKLAKNVELKEKLKNVRSTKRFFELKQ